VTGSQCVGAADGDISKSKKKSTSAGKKSDLAFWVEQAEKRLTGWARAALLLCVLFELGSSQLIQVDVNLMAKVDLTERRGN